MKVASLFSGCGGFDLGFKQAGHEIVFAVDKDPVACETYNASVGRAICSDIQNIDDLPDCDIVIGGPPCQGFSIASRRRKKKTDERNNLIAEFARLVCIVHPQYFIMENVPGLLFPIFADVFQPFVRQMVENGYAVMIRKMNAANYGVPQARKRIFIYGSLDAMPPCPKPTHEPKQDTICIEGMFLKPYVTVNDVLGWTETKILSQNRSTYKMKKAEKGYFYSSNRLGRTMTAGGHSICFPEPSRMMTVQESAKIQMFPDNFEFKGNVSQQRQQIGNAVPPLLAERIAEVFGH